MKTLKKMKIRHYISIILGTAFIAFGIQCIYDPIGLVTGGFTGIAIIVKTVTMGLIDGGVPLWLTNVMLNIPVFIIAYMKMGKRFIGRTLFGTIMLSVWLYVIPVIDIAQGDLLIAALFGGAFSGFGMGLVLLSNATTGGTDMVSALIHCKVRHYNVAQIMQVLDGAIVVAGFFVFGLHNTLYAVIAIIVTTYVSDMILEGFKFSKAAYIITNHYDEVAETIMSELDRGVTGLKAIGMYTGTDKCVLYCVVSKKEIVTIKEIVAEIDPKAFVIVSDVREVLGEGFQEHIQEHQI